MQPLPSAQAGQPNHLSNQPGFAVTTLGGKFGNCSTVVSPLRATTRDTAQDAVQLQRRQFKLARWHVIILSSLYMRFPTMVLRYSCKVLSDQKITCRAVCGGYAGNCHICTCLALQANFSARNRDMHASCRQARTSLDMMTLVRIWVMYLRQWELLAWCPHLPEPAAAPRKHLQAFQPPWQTLMLM